MEWRTHVWPKVSLFRIPPPLCIFLAPFLVHNFVFGAGITPYVLMTKSAIPSKLQI